MQRTDNFNLIVVEGSDNVNLLTQMNPNTEIIDEQMFKNQNSGVQTATELLNGTVHAITRKVSDASVIRFTAVSRFTTGDTFTVDGVQVSALLPSGEQLPDGAYIIGSEVLCILKGTLLTVYCNNTTAKNSEKLGGELPSYYATKSNLDYVSNVADSASSLSENNRQDVDMILNGLSSYVVGDSTGEVEITVPANSFLEYNNAISKDGYVPFALSGWIANDTRVSLNRVRFVNLNGALHINTVWVNNSNVPVTTRVAINYIWLSTKFA